MPQAVAAVVSYGIGAITGGATVAGSVAATIGTIAGYTAVVGGSVAYSASQTRKLKKAMAGAGAIDQGRNVMVRDPLAPRFHVYGEVPVSGPIVFMQSTGANNEYLHLVVVLGDGPYAALGEVRFGDTVVPLDGNGEATGTYAGHVRIKKFLGDLAGERDLDLESESNGEWTENHLGKGIARLHVRLKHNPELFPDGIPAITCMVKGVLVYDERTELTDWTDNAALCTSHWLTFEKYGKGIAYSRLIEGDLIEAANICDEEVVLADESTEKRYTCNGVAYAGDPDGTLSDLLAAMAGHVCDAGGRWIIRAGAWRAPGITLTQSELISPLSVVPRQSRQDTFNGVRGTYISPINQWVPADFPAVKNDTYMGWDGGKRLWKDVAYNFVTSPATAQRLAKIELERGRQQASFSGTYMLKAMQCQPGDVIGKTWTPLGWSAKSFEVVNWGFALVPGDEDSGPTLGVALAARETAEGVWDWNDGEETEVDLAPNTNLRDPRSVTNPSSLTLTNDPKLQSDGTSLSRLRASWTLPADDFVRLGGFYLAEFQLNGEGSSWRPLPPVRGDQNFVWITDVIGGLQYRFRIRSRNVLGVDAATWVTSSYATVSGDTTIPSNPTSFTFIAGNGQSEETPPPLIYRYSSNGHRVVMKAMTAKFTPSVSTDVAFVEFVTAADVTGANIIYDSNGPEARVSGKANKVHIYKVGEDSSGTPSDYSTLRLFVKCVDWSGNVSTFTDCGLINSYLQKPAAGEMILMNSNAVTITGGEATLSKVVTPYFESGVTTASDFKDSNVRIYDGTTQTARIDYTNGRYYVQGSPVLNTRVGSTPATLGDVIAVLQHHGLSD